MKNLEKQDEKDSKLNNFVDAMFGITEKTKSEKLFYPLPKKIKDELIRDVDRIKEVLKGDKETEHYIFKQLLLSYSNYKIKDETIDWIHDNYSYSTAKEGVYSELISASGGLFLFMKKYHPLILKEVQNNILSSGFYSDDEYRSTLHLSVMHEFIRISDIEECDVKALGESYEEMI